MIAFLRGEVSALSSSRETLVLDIGVMGVSVNCTRRMLASVHVGDRLTLCTSMVIREDAWTIYGFVDAHERDAFEAVQTVTGIGPRIALALLGALTPDELRAAVHEEDVDALMGVPGIGRKGAARIALELKDRLGPPTGGPTLRAPGAVDSDWATAVHAGLMSLGWSAREATAAVETVAPLAREDPQPDVAALLRAALVSLDRR